MHRIDTSLEQLQQVTANMQTDLTNLTGRVGARWLACHVLDLFVQRVDFLPQRRKAVKNRRLLLVQPRSQLRQRLAECGAINIGIGSLH